MTMDEKLKFDLTFPRDYEAEEAELPGSGQAVVYQPSGSSSHGKDGLLLRLRPGGGNEWLGCFAFGHRSYPSGVFATPDPEHLCVISHGTPYWVNTRDPLDCSILEFAPVLEARPLSEQKLLLMADFISIALIDGDGKVWRSPRLCWDELRITQIEEGVVSGLGYDPLNVGESHFSFDVKTRRVLKSGYPPELGML